MISTLVKELTEERFGQKISNPTDCFGLAEDIRIKTGHTINLSTLQGMMGQKDILVEPSTEELDILAVYIGYPNWVLLPKEIKDGTGVKMTPEEAEHYWRWKGIHAEMWRYWGFFLIAGTIAAIIIWVTIRH